MKLLQKREDTYADNVHESSSNANKDKSEIKKFMKSEDTCKKGDK